MNSRDIISGAFERHSDLIKKTAQNIIGDIKEGALVLSKAINDGQHIFICGNGGSAADSQHLAAEMVCKYKKDRRALPAIALTVNTSTLTATGNDYDFENIFSRQVEALGKKGDVLVAITTSGSSKNILSAIAKAKELGMVVIALTGARGEYIDADLRLIVPSEETARIQEIHEVIYHSWCEYIDTQTG